MYNVCAAKTQIHEECSRFLPEERAIEDIMEVFPSRRIEQSRTFDSTQEHSTTFQNVPGFGNIPDHCRTLY